MAIESIMTTKIRHYLLTVFLCLLVYFSFSQYFSHFANKLTSGSVISNSDHPIRKEETKHTVHDATAIASKGFANQSRLALVIGNSDYSVGRLKNAANDAETIAAALEKQGFKVTLLTDIKTQQDFENAVEQFIAQLSGKDIALFFYSGHGVQGDDGSNYLIPTQASIESAYQIKHKALRVQYVIDGMKEKHAGLNLLILDACRDTPFPNASRGGASKGFSRMDAPDEMLISYATAPNQTADDGDGAHSPYAQAFLDSLETDAHLPMTEFFNQIGVKVRTNTASRQSPRLEISPLQYHYCFRDCNGTALSISPSKPEVAMCPDILLNIQEIESKSDKLIDEQIMLNGNLEIFNSFKEGEAGRNLYRNIVSKNKTTIAAYKQEITVQLQNVHKEHQKDIVCIGKQLAQAQTRLQANASLKAAQATIRLLNTVTEIPANSAATDDYFSELVKNYHFN